jgi:Mrp family chromosome partitioning ATPase
MRDAVRLVTYLTIGGLALAWTAIALSPTRYMASAAVMLPEGAATGSRVVSIRHAEDDPKLAAAMVSHSLEDYRRQKAVVIDPIMVSRRAPDAAMGLAAGGAGGLLLGLGLALAKGRRRKALRTETDFVRTLGQPVLAARPLRAECLDGLCRQLLEHWLTPQRRLLPVVSAEPGDGRSSVAAELAKRFAAMGEKVLLVDADFRSPSQHARFGLPNKAGLADFLAGGGTGIASCGENLGILVAGSCRSDALDALSSPRLPALLVEAGKHFRVVIIDTPAAARGPDLQMPAALAGGALVVARAGAAHADGVEQLHKALRGARACVVTTLINHA